MKKNIGFYCDFDFDEVFYLNQNLESFLIPKDKNDKTHLINIQNNINRENYLLLVDSGDSKNLYGFQKINLIATTPEPNVICIVFGNIAYFVNALKPLDYILASPEPLMNLHLDILNKLIIIFYYDKVIAYRKHSEVIWETKFMDLIEEGYSIDAIEESSIILKYYNSQWEMDRKIKINIVDGEFQHINNLD